MPNPSRSQLRQQLREARKALSEQQQCRAALALSRHVACIPEFIRAKRVASYCASDGEIDPIGVMARARQMKKRIYLPVIDDKGMAFYRCENSRDLDIGPWGILAPTTRDPNKRALPLSLDLFLVPLVGFDDQGRRLGRGGGYYDRFLAKRKELPHSVAGKRSKPFLLGLAHRGQQLAAIDARDWDIPLDAIATDHGVIRPMSNSL